ncbi:MAG TPA: DUF1566 domain-containing protein, partial [Alphaproteobacteria bacterium]|nr:DUF1566 domain-containing protein [Alphaproteobacteria bacterium]
IEGHWTDDGLCRSLVPTIAPHEGRFYLETTPIQISAETTGTTIRYTLDGTEPTATVGTLYTDPFVIADGGKKKLKAKVFREGMADSITAVAEYRVIQITCSGQTKCYDNSGEVTCPTEGNDFYGQDAQYAVLGMCIPKSYTVSGATPEEIVTDNNTGLQWQRTLSGNTYTWDNAVAYCEGLAYGGHSDWRLPNYRELESIVEYGRSSPAIDTDAFPGTFSDDFWSSSFCADNTGYAWDINFNYGYFQGYTKISSYHVRCVRVKSQSEELTFTEEAVSGGVVVNETVTGLQWAKEYASSVNWQSALAYCENLNYGGYIDWRLPNIDELKTLINRSRYAPASDFPEMPSAYFWSSSSLAGNALSAWRVNFDDGYVSSNGKYNDYLARCVR